MELKEQLLKEQKDIIFQILDKKLEDMKSTKSSITRHNEFGHVTEILNIAFKLGIISEQDKLRYYSDFNYARVWGSTKIHIEEQNDDAEEQNDDAEENHEVIECFYNNYKFLC